MSVVSCEWALVVVGAYPNSASVNCHCDGCDVTGRYVDDEFESGFELATVLSLSGVMWCPVSKYCVSGECWNSDSILGSSSSTVGVI